MDKGLQEIFKSNAWIVISGSFGFIVLLGGIIVKLILRIDKKRDDNSKQRFSDGEERFKRIEEGQKEIIREIKEGQKKDSGERKEIKNRIGSISDRLLILQTQHDDNHCDVEHNRRIGDKDDQKKNSSNNF